MLEPQPAQAPGGGGGHKEMERQSAAAALARFHAGDLSGAEAICRDACSSGKVDINILYILSIIERRKGRFQESVAILCMVLNAHYDLPHGFYNLAITFLHAGDRIRALETLKKALAIEPQNSEALCELGRLQHAHAPIGEAAASFERACRIRPDLTDAWTNTLRLWRMMKSPRITERHFKVWRSLSPDSPTAYTEFTCWLLRRDRFEDASKALDRALLIEPDSGEAAVFDAHRHVLNRSPKAALAAFRRSRNANTRVVGVQRMSAPQRAAAFPHLSAPQNSARRCVIVDPALYSQYGHHYNMTATIYNEMRKRGYDNWIYCGGSTVEKVILEQYPVETIFFMEGHDILSDMPHPYDKIRFKISRNLYFAEELKNIPHDVLQESVVIFHTVDSNTALGIALWLKQLPVGLIRRLLVNVMAVDCFDPISNRPTPWRRCYQALQHAARQQSVDLRLTAENTAIAADLAATCGGRTVDLFPYHVVDDFTRPPQPRKSNQRITVAFLSSWTQDRGGHLLPEVVRLVNAHRDDVDFVFKMDWIAWEKLRNQTGADPSGNAFSEKNVQLTEAGLSATQYYEVLANADILLLPYAGRYMKASSGIFYEALSFGKVMITPSGSVMHQEAGRFAAAAVGFNQQNASDVAAAVLAACRQLSALQEKAQAAAAWWKSHFSPKSCFDRFLSGLPQ